MTKDYKIIFSTSDNKQREVSMHVPEEIGTYKAVFSLSNNVAITASGNIIVDATERTYNLKFKLSNGNVINAGNFKTKGYVPYVFTVSGAPHNYAVCLSVTAGSVPATVTFAGITKTAPANATTTISFTNSDTSVTAGEVEVRNSLYCGCGAFSYEDGGKSHDYRWDAIKSVISFDSEWTELGSYLLYGAALTSPLPSIPDQITEIGNYAFNGVTGLCESDFPTRSTITLSNTQVTRIGDFAFTGSDVGGLGFEMPSTLKIIGDSAFQACENLVIFSVPDSVTSMGESCFASSGITSPSIGSGVTELPDSLFFNCQNLQSVKIPSQITRIGQSCFFGCTDELFSSIEVPSSVKSLGQSCFAGCTSLAKVVLNPGLQSIESNVFNNNSPSLGLIFNGTKAQWNAITKADNWTTSSGATAVECTDGTIIL